MKKFLFAVMAIVAVALAGCSKDENNAPSLSGTVWEEVESNGTIARLTFQSAINCNVFVDIANSPLAVSNDYTYEYNHPNVTMYPTDPDNAELRGYIDGNRMNVVNTSSGETIYALTKK